MEVFGIDHRVKYDGRNLGSSLIAMPQSLKTGYQCHRGSGFASPLEASPSGGRREAAQGESIPTSKPLRRLAGHFGQQLLFALALTKPARVVLSGGGFAAQQVQGA